MISWATSSEASSSISVVSVPFEVTGEGPTISLGLIICRPLGESPSSIPIDDLGRSDEDSAELRADLSRIISRVHWNQSHRIHTVIEIAANWLSRESLEIWRSLYKGRRST